MDLVEPIRLEIMDLFCGQYAFGQWPFVLGSQIRRQGDLGASEIRGGWKLLLIHLLLLCGPGYVSYGHVRARDHLSIGADFRYPHPSKILVEFHSLSLLVAPMPS